MSRRVVFTCDRCDCSRDLKEGVMRAVAIHVNPLSDELRAPGTKIVELCKPCEDGLLVWLKMLKP